MLLICNIRSDIPLMIIRDFVFSTLQNIGKRRLLKNALQINHSLQKGDSDFVLF
jgi:hypothetical protein